MKTYFYLKGDTIHVSEAMKVWVRGYPLQPNFVKGKLGTNGRKFCFTLQVVSVLGLILRGGDGNLQKQKKTKNKQ